MGQQIGKPVQLQPGISPFVNLPKSIVLDFRCAVTEVSESGYSLCLQELQQIIQLCLHEYLTDEKIIGYANALFGLFNADAKKCDDRDEVDTFQFLGTLCIVSGMTLEQKAEFLFDLFDLNEKGEVNINEVTLAFRSLFYGTRKILVGDAENNVNNVDIDQVALEAFELVMPDNLKYSLAMANDMADKKLSRQQFFDYIFNCPEAVSFLLKHDDIIIGEENNDNVTNHDCEQVERVINGIQSSAIEPWRDQIRLLLQPDTSDERASPPPMDGLRIDHIHGRNSNTDTVYTSNGDIVYAAGSTVVKIVVGNDGRYQQEFFNEHTNRVSTIDIFKVNDEMGDMVASGEVSISNDCPSKVCVWSSATLSSLVTFQTIHKNGVSKLCFSPSGELLLAVGRSHNDKDALIGVYKWRERRLVFASKIPGSSFYDCSFLYSDNSFGICGDQTVHFWSQAQPDESYRHYRGATNLFSSKEHMTSIACVGSAIVTGSASGTLWLWEGRVCIKRVQVFRFPITRLFADNVGLCVSTRNDGNIHILGMDLELQRSINPTRSLQNSLMVESLCRDSQQEKLLFSDSSDGIREIDLKNLDEGSESHLIMSSRSTLTDFAIESLTCNIVTVGMDGVVTVWDKDDSNVLQQHSLGRKLSCVACREHDGKEVAVGFYSDENGSSNKSNVAFVILGGDDVTKIIHRGQNSQKTITVCRYSSDGRFVAFGSEDSSVYIHSTDNDYPLVAKGRGHSSPISTFDFGRKEGSDTTSFLRSNSINGEALFWNTHGKTVTPLSQRHTCWESHTCVYSNNLEGAHDLYAQENNADITSCCPLAKTDAQSIAVGDSRGQIRVFSYPALSKDCIYLQFQSHHGSVHKLILSNDSLYSLGREDSCICKWNISSLSWPHTMPPSVDNDSVIIKEKRRDETAERSIDLATATAQLEVLDFSIRNGNTSSPSPNKPIRPWLRSIVPPSSYKPRLGPLPDSSLLLERVHGYDGRTANNLHYLSSGDGIVYSVGKTLIRYDDHGSAQHFAQVDGGITCLALHKEKSLCAVGQDDRGIVIVDVKTMNYLCRIAADDIRCLAFDESGSYLVVVDGNRLIVYNLDDDGSIISSTHTHATMTLAIKFTKKASNELVECGMNYVRFWLIKGGVMIFEDANMTTMENPTTFYSCIGWSGNDVLVGTSTGNVIRFAGKVPIDKVKVHTTKVTNISSASDGRFAISAANHVKLYDAKMRCIIAIDTKETLGVSDTISSLSWHAESRKIVIGTEGNQVWEISSEDGSNLRTKDALINAHASSPMAISPNPNGTTYATVGDDGFLRFFDAFNHDEHSSFDLTMPSRACAFSPDGNLLAAGFGTEVKNSAKTINGRLVIGDVNDSSGYRIIAERRDSRKHIREIKWHSSGDRLAVGTDKIFVYALKTDTNPAINIDVSLIATIDITSPAIHFDFSKDGKYLRVNSESNELLWVEADSAIRIKEPSFMKDMEWESQTCVFDWNVQGVHLDGGVNVNSVDSYSSSVISGGDDGQLRLFSYPCTSTRANYLCYTGHNGPVASVRMLAGGSHLISTGVNDQAVMVWRHHDVDDDPLVDAGLQKESAVIDTHDETDTNRCMAFYDSVDQIIFPSSGVCVVLDAKRCTQQLFQGHDSQIGAIALSKSRQLVASGDSCDNSPVIKIWDPQTCTEIVELSDSRLRGVSLLAFSPNAKRLACVCSDENHKIFIWNTLNGSWNDSYLYAQHALGGHEKINFIQMTQTHLITGGKTLNFWSFVPTLSLSKGVLSTDYSTEELLCGAIVGDNKLITGTSGGTFITWDIAKKKIVNECEYQAHTAAITALCACPEGLVSANSEGLITLWSSDMQKIQVFDTGSLSPIHSLDVSSHSNGRSTVKILALDPSNCFEISCITGRVSKTFQFDDRNDVPTCKTEMETHSNRIA